MGKLMLLLSFICLGILLVFGLVAPGSPVMWLASTSKGFAELRIIIMIVLTLLMVTDPPRHPILRVFVGVGSLALFGWTLYGTYNSQIMLVDMMALLSASVAAGLAALERTFEEKPISFERESQFRIV